MQAFLSSFKEEGYASCNCLQKKLFAWILQVVNDGGWVFWWALKTHRKDHVDIKVAIAKLPPEMMYPNTKTGLQNSFLQMSHSIHMYSIQIDT